jgi:hypothetical protein
MNLRLTAIRSSFSNRSPNCCAVTPPPYRHTLVSGERDSIEHRAQLHKLTEQDAENGHYQPPDHPAEPAKEQMGQGFFPPLTMLHSSRWFRWNVARGRAGYQGQRMMSVAMGSLRTAPCVASPDQPPLASWLALPSQLPPSTHTYGHGRTVSGTGTIQRDTAVYLLVLQHIRWNQYAEMVLQAA